MLCVKYGILGVNILFILSIGIYQLFRKFLSKMDK